MIRRKFEAIIAQGEEAGMERGATLVLASMILVVLMGMAGFAVDLGWLYYRSTEAQKAAESAALAGVVHMPSPTGVPWTGTEAYQAAIDVAEAAGYKVQGSTKVIPSPVATHPNRMTVAIENVETTFFMRVFGVDTVTVNKTATAETLPPLRLGSDESFLGEDPECDLDPTCPNGTRDTDLWLAVNGDRTPKGQGDPFTPECYGAGPADGCVGNNFEYRSPSYWYAVDVPQSEVGKSLQLQIYDPGHSPGGVANDWELSVFASLDFRIRVLEPDQTPSDPTDNAVVLCDMHFRNRNNAAYDPATSDAWVNLCSPVSAKRGIYVIEVSVTGDVDLLNAFSLRARMNGSANANVALYGIGAMSLWTPESNSSPTFKLVRIDPVYKGTQLIIELWDPGDLGQPGTLEFLGSLSGVECEVRTRDHRGHIIADWHADDGGSGCLVSVAVQEHNNQWVDFKFNIPAGHSCSGDACWSTVRYGFSGSTTDRTTWAARINGGPVHLVP